MSKSERYHEAETPAKPAITKLGKSCARILKSECDELARSLVDKAKDGHVSSIKLLIDLIDRIPPPAPRKKKKLTWAQRIALQPEWTGPLPVSLDHEEPLEGVFDLGDHVLQAGADPAWPDPNYTDLQSPQPDAGSTSNSLVVVQQTEDVVSLEAVAAPEDIELHRKRQPRNLPESVRWPRRIVRTPTVTRRQKRGSIHPKPALQPKVFICRYLRANFNRCRYLQPLLSVNH